MEESDISSTSAASGKSVGFSGIDSLDELRELFPSVVIDDRSQLPKAKVLRKDTFLALMSRYLNLKNFFDLTLRSTNEKSSYFSTLQLLSCLVSLDHKTSLEESRISENSWTIYHEDTLSSMMTTPMASQASGGKEVLKSRIGFIYEIKKMAPDSDHIAATFDNQLYQLYAQMCTAIQMNRELGFATTVYGCYGTASEFFFVSAEPQGLEEDGPIILTRPGTKMLFLGQVVERGRSYVKALDSTKDTLERLLFCLYENRLDDDTIKTACQNVQSYLDTAFEIFSKSFDETKDEQLAMKDRELALKDRALKEELEYVKRSHEFQMQQQAAEMERRMEEREARLLARLKAAKGKKASRPGK